QVHRGVNLRFAGRSHRVDFDDLTGGKAITLYPQHEVIKDLVAERVERGGAISFGVTDVALHDLEGPRPRVTFRDAEGVAHELVAGAIAGCDGFHGVSRPSIPPGVLTEHAHDYPFGWFGMLVEAPRSTEELIYARHARGFALSPSRTPSLQRYYLQCAPHDDVADWPDERIGTELRARLAGDDGYRLTEGPLTQKGVIAMRSFVVEPMQHGRL